MGIKFCEQDVNWRAKLFEEQKMFCLLDWFILTKVDLIRDPIFTAAQEDMTRVGQNRQLKSNSI